jgi:hypothetical protein
MIVDSEPTAKKTVACTMLVHIYMVTTRILVVEYYTVECKVSPAEDPANYCVNRCSGLLRDSHWRPVGFLSVGHAYELLRPFADNDLCVPVTIVLHR